MLIDFISTYKFRSLLLGLHTQPEEAKIAGLIYLQNHKTEESRIDGLLILLGNNSKKRPSEGYTMLLLSYELNTDQF